MLLPIFGFFEPILQAFFYLVGVEKEKNTMFIGPVSTEIVYQIPNEDERQVLQEHFNLFYIILSENPLVPEAAFKTINGIQRCLSGIPAPYHNAVLGCPKNNWDKCIDEQLNYFHTAKLPFVWYVDEDSSPDFKQRLLDHGFQDGGIFRGVIGFLDKPIPIPEIPDDCALELVKDEAGMEEFNDLVCTVFAIAGESKDLYKKVMWSATKNEHHAMFHWIARKQGKAVSAVSTMIEGEMVSFWNGASLPEIRQQGLNTALRRFALKDAMSKGCHVGSSYLMSEGMAFGICSKLGYQTKWRFNTFLSPGVN